MIKWTLRREIDQIERLTWLIAMAVVIAGVALSAPVAAQEPVQPPAVRAYVLTPERLAALVAVVVGLIGAVVGGLALVRSAARIGHSGRRGARVALVMGPISLALGAMIVATADGGLGTGNGLAGGVVAMMVGAIGMTLGGVALARSRRAA